jgi:hypothetical protein
MDRASQYICVNAGYGPHVPIFFYCYVFSVLCILCTVCVKMCTALLPPGVNPMCTVLLPPGVNPMCTVLLPPVVNPISVKNK